MTKKYTFWNSMLPSNCVFLIILSTIFQIQITGVDSYGQRARGFVYYPPYSDPYSDSDRCVQLFQWRPEYGDTFKAPKLTDDKCIGSLSDIEFSAPNPKSTENPNEAKEHYIVDYISRVNPESDESIFDELVLFDKFFENHQIMFNCQDNRGVVRKPAMYFWLYQYRFRRVVKSHSFQTMMPWDNDGNMVFQPTEPRPANITCHYYDPSKGSFIKVRTWQISYGKAFNKLDTSTAKIVECGSNSSKLTERLDTKVVVTSNRLEFSAFCPVASCKDPTVVSSP